MFSKILRLLRAKNAAGACSAKATNNVHYKPFLESLEDRITPAPVSSVILPGAGSVTVLLGDPANFNVGFDNTGDATGYGPYIDLFLDVTGADGIFPGTPPPTNTYDGFDISSFSATYLGAALPSTTLITLGAGGTYTHPLTGEALVAPAGFTQGDVVAVLELPFGSFTVAQPQADIAVNVGTSNLADVGTPLPVAAIAGFRFGADPLDNPIADPPIRGATANSDVTPVLWQLTKTYLGPEDETATGANYPRRYLIEGDIATGQTIDAVTITDTLANSMQWTGDPNVVMIVQGSTIPTNTTGSTATITTPGGDIVANFGTITGIDGNDFSLNFEFFIPRDRSTGVEVLPQDSASGTDSVFDNNTARSDGNWTPIDSRDASGPVSIVLAPNAHTLQEHSIAVQKSVTPVDMSGTPTGGTIIPGSTLLRYDIDFQVSDYYAFQDIFLEDIFGDGQRLYLAPGFLPSLQVDNAYNTSTNTRSTAAASPFAGAGTIEFSRRYTEGDPLADPTTYGPGAPGGPVFTDLGPGPIDGSTFLRFRISDELINRGFTGGMLVGGDIPNGGGAPQNNNPPLFGATQGRIVFYTEVRQNFSDEYIALGTDPSVDQLDVLRNNVPLIQGDQVDATDLLGVIGIGTDDTSASVSLPVGTLNKTIYAVNGQTTNLTYGSGIVSVQAGDLITYKLTYSLPTSDFENLRIVDFPPLPVLPVPASMSFSTAGGIPGVNTATFGPDDTYFATFGFGPRIPAITTDASSNFITFDFGTFDDIPQHRSTQIDLLFTLQVGSQAFANDLFLTNQMRVLEGSTNAGDAQFDQIVQFELVQPDVDIYKGIVGYETTGLTLGGISFSDPGSPSSFTGTVATPAEAGAIGGSDLVSNEVDAGDEVRYAIVLQNQGRGDAFDTLFTDTIQPEYVLPASAATFATDVNLTVRHGDGTLLATNALVNGFAQTATTADLGAPYNPGPSNGQFTGVSRTIDGVFLYLGDRVLVKDQTVASQNGIYVVSALDTNGTTVTLTRASDFDQDAELTSGYTVAVLGGGNSANRFFSVPGPITLNTTPINWTDNGIRDYYYTYDPATGSFTIGLADNYTAGNTANPTQDTRSGALSRGTAGDGSVQITNGSNSIVVTYDLTLRTPPSSPLVYPRETITNTATVTRYSAGEGGADRGPLDSDPSSLSDTANVVIKDPTVDKTLVGTEITEPGNNAANQAVIGELITYTVTVTVPEGEMPNADIFDTLDSGLAFVDVTAVSASPDLTFSGGGLPTIGATPANTTITNNGRDIVFNFGTITNNNTDNSVAETITITYRAVVVNQSSNQSGATRNNLARFRWTDTGNTTTFSVQDSAANVNLREPTLAVQKDVRNVTQGGTFGQTTRADNLDILEYRITITNGSASTDTTAFDISLNDVLPAPFTSPSISSVTSTGNIDVNGVTTPPGVSDFQIVGNTLSNVSNIDMESNSSITLIISGTYSGSTGQVATNTAEVRWTSLDGTVVNRSLYNADSDERDGTDGLLGSGVLNDYRVQDTADIQNQPSVRKTIVASSEGHTTDPDAAIGEIVRYRLVTSIGEGVTRNFQLQDNIPTGMAFLNDGTARYAFISSSGSDINSTGIPNITGLGSAAGIAGDETTLPGLASASIVGLFNDNNIATDFAGAGTGEPAVFASGSDVFFRFGDLNNTDNDTNAEYVVVEFNALVLNEAGNQDGSLLPNSYTVLVDTDGDGSPGYISVANDDDGNGFGDTTIVASDPDNNAGTGPNTPAFSTPVNVNVVEPNLNIVKRALATTGSVVTYEVVVTNVGSTTAFDVVVFDVLPASLDLNVPSITISTTGGATSGTADHDDPSNRMRFIDVTMPAASTVTITYTANIVTPGVQIDNTANTNYTSLPGTGTNPNTTGSVTPGGSGTTTGERDGSGGVNDYSTSDTESLGSLGDFVWYDVDRDGVQDPGEPGIPGATVTVVWFGPNGIDDGGAGDDSVITTVTDASGNYLVSGLPLGTGANNYRVFVTNQPNDLTQPTFDLDSGTTSPDGTTLVALTSANPNPRNVDFGFVGNGSIGDTVYYDLNNNQIQDGAEVGIPGVDVQLTWFGFDGVAGGGDDVVQTLTTNNNVAINYDFLNLPSGNYTVDVVNATVPPNLSLTTANDPLAVSLSSGQDFNDADFGYRGIGTIGDRIFLDLNNNGLFDPNEGIDGVTVNLSVDLNFDGTNEVFSVTTTGDGFYQFTNLPTNDGSGNGFTYTVSVVSGTLPAGVTQTVDPDGTLDNTSTVTLTDAASTDLDQDFGYRGPGSIGDSIFLDVDNDGVADTGEGITGVDVTLTGDFDGDGTNEVLTTTTDIDGNYLFSGLVTNNITYTVTVDTTDLPAGVSNTTDPDGGLDSTSTVTLTNASPVNLDQDFGYRGPGSIGDTIFLDVDNDGVPDTGEGITGVDVTLTGDFDGDGTNEVLTTTTDIDGKYLFSGLVTNDGSGGGITYTVNVVSGTLPAGVTQTVDPDGTLDNTSTVTLTDAAPTDLDQDFGYRVDGQVGDTIFLDVNNNGIADPGEGISGVTVTLTGDYDGDGFVEVLTTTTDANGIYLFTGLVTDDGSGNGIPYVVDVIVATLPVGVVNTTDPDGGFDNTSALTLTNANPVRLDQDFGYRGSGSIGDIVFLDDNPNNNLPDPGEGVANIDVFLTGDFDGDGLDETLVTTTDANGNYLFSGLVTNDGLGGGITYTVQIDATDLPNNFTQTVDPDGVLDNMSQVTLTDVDPVNLDQDFGYVETADLEIFKLVDTTQQFVSFNVTFTFIINNLGPGPATNVVVQDPFPPGLEFITAGTPSQGVYDATTGIWNIGTMAAGARETLTIVARVTQAGTIVNNARVGAVELDPNLTNNNDSVTIAANYLLPSMISKRLFLASTSLPTATQFIFAAPGAAPLQATGGAVLPGADVAPLDASQLANARSEAIRQFAQAGLDPTLLGLLQSIPVGVADLPAGYLGLAFPDQILIDVNAAGYGWTLDVTSMPQRIDLLTVVSHEFGHVLGLPDFDHHSGSLMSGFLGTGERRQPSPEMVGTTSATPLPESAAEADTNNVPASHDGSRGVVNEGSRPEAETEKPAAPATGDNTSSQSSPRLDPLAPHTSDELTDRCPVEALDEVLATVGSQALLALTPSCNVDEPFDVSALDQAFAALAALPFLAQGQIVRDIRHKARYRHTDAVG
ncbi:MAG: hypothetical protein KatS3mg105_0622 [Gemmatales bacterium]|nr:MAG: hypothetical protein KatS3mg105_0622 [Gemmatales bacterium]